MVDNKWDGKETLSEGHIVRLYGEEYEVIKAGATNVALAKLDTEDCFTVAEVANLFPTVHIIKHDNLEDSELLFEYDIGDGVLAYAPYGKLYGELKGLMSPQLLTRAEVVRHLPTGYRFDERIFCEEDNMGNLVPGDKSLFYFWIDKGYKL